MLGDGAASKAPTKPYVCRMDQKIYGGGGRSERCSMHADNLLHHWQHGGRPSRSAISLAMNVGFQLDQAISLQGPHLYGLSLDLVKMFDTLPLPAGDQILKLWDVRESLRLLWLHHFQQCQTHYRWLVACTLLHRRARVDALKETLFQWC